MKDRIAQAAVKRVIEPIFEKIFCDCSYGFRLGRSRIDAINKVEKYKEDGYWIPTAKETLII
ncbi:hypothetical protein [Sporohalobacter salinus]|uniref:hypothetical protein n=1 Tax=Sporohalobacter salinus TaxID=1494606 RepID=UPI00195FD22F|nr:retron-type reverse transcriptase [Sporohalobacter salinus]